MKKLKKGFTIVELVIVIAVIAILASVLIPVFSNVVDKANLSADQQAVRHMNTAIATYDDIENIADLKIRLTEDNIDANNYKPLTKDTEFFWTGKKIVMVQGDKVIYPEDAKGPANKDAWFSLSGNGNKDALEDIRNGTVEAGEVLNMQGASVNLTPTNGFTLGSDNPDNLATIKNVVSDEGSKVIGNTGEYADNHYYAGLIKQVAAGTTVTVKNLIIDGAVIGDTTVPYEDSARVGIIAGEVSGTLNIENVTIKNSTVFGGYRVGALVGSVTKSGTVNVKNVKLENVTVKAGSVGAVAIGEVRKVDGATVNFVNFDKGNVIVEALSNSTIEIKDGEKYVYLWDSTDSKYAYFPQVTTKNFWVKTNNEPDLQEYWYGYKAQDNVESPSN